MSTENKTSVETASDSPVAHQRLVRARHPWQQMFNNQAKLKAARAAAARRRELKWHAAHDDLSKNLHRDGQRKRYRKRVGAPVDAPISKPWDFAKGKCPNGEVSERRPADAKQTQGASLD